VPWGRRRCPEQGQQDGSQGTDTHRQGAEVFACTDHAKFACPRKGEKPQKNGPELTDSPARLPTHLGKEPLSFYDGLWTTTRFEWGGYRREKRWEENTPFLMDAIDEAAEK